MIETALHFFTPRFSNNHKARILHAQMILAIGFIVVVLQGLIYVGTYSKIAILGYAANISISEVITLTNLEREEKGLTQLKINEDLTEAARQKGLDMLANNYWAHISPQGVEPWAFFKDVGYEYRYAGENLARDFSNPTSAVEAWMASPSHRENLLSEKYEEIGIAVVEGDLNGVDTTIIVSLFGTRSNSKIEVPAVAAETDSETIAVAIAAEPEFKQAAVLEINENVSSTSIASPFSTTRIISIVVMGIISIALIIDIIEVERRKISRVSGRNFAHLVYLATIIMMIIALKVGEIL